MFGTSKVDLELEVLFWQQRYIKLQIRFDKLVGIAEHYKAKAAGSSPRTSSLSDEDIKKLLMLCHPDKHGGKSMASEMTTKLLAMRK